MARILGAKQKIKVTRFRSLQSDMYTGHECSLGSETYLCKMRSTRALFTVG